jgi:predicted oxidoreductase
VEAALEAGVTHFDHADIYCQGKSELVFSEVWSRRPGLRDQIVVQSKCGIRLPAESGAAFGYYDFSREHIQRAVEGSLRRLRTDRLDVLLLHRPDTLVEPEEVAAAFDSLHASGKVLHFGVSNHSAAQLELLAKYVRQPLVVNQLELNIVHTGLIDQGVVMNRAGSSYDGTGTLEYCRLHGITIQAYGPLAKGYLCGRPIDSRVEGAGRLAAAAREVNQMAQQKGVTAEAICTAWLLRHPARIQPVIGTTDPARIKGACQGASIELDRAEWYRLFIAGRGGPVP